MNIKGKKLLVLGGVAMIAELVENAQNRGAYVIVADYYENSPAKRIADEAWLISTSDTEKLVEKCKEIGVDGVIAAFDDFNVGCAQKLSDSIGKPFYATGEQVNRTMNKENFKQLCRDTNVPTIPEFYLDDNLLRSDLDNMVYPIIVKPVDGSGARGITICYNEEELLEAYKFAKKISKSGNVIIEKYIVGDEIGVNYILRDGEIFVSALHDRYMKKTNGNSVRLPVAYVYPSKYTKSYLKLENESVINMFRSIGMKNGTLFLQGCMEGEICHFYEMGYRLNGAKQYQILDKLCGFNPMEMIVNYSLTGKMSEEEIANKVNPEFPKMCCTLSVLARPAKIKKIIGLEEIEKFEETIAITPWYKEGEEITKDALGTQKQIAVRITLCADDTQKLAEIIDKVYETLEILDDSGDSILLEQFDTKELF